MRLIVACEQRNLHQISTLLQQDKIRNNPNQIEPISGLSLLYYVYQLDPLKEKVLPIISLLIQNGVQREAVTPEDEQFIAGLTKEDKATLDKIFAEKQEEPKAKAEEKYFEAIEHAIIGNSAFDKFIIWLKTRGDKGIFSQLIQSFAAEKGRPLFNLGEEKATKKRLSAGAIICLAGDYYGATSESEVISFGEDDKEKEKRFKNIYQKLVNADSDEVIALLGQIFSIYPDILKAASGKNGIIPSHVFKKRGRTDDVAYLWLTKQYPHSVFIYCLSRYAELGMYNFDHFGEDAKEAYKAGHRVACQTASSAKTKEDLEKAIAQELFANHFLTDLFSAGHMRTPRRALYYHFSGKNLSPLVSAAALSWKMHDEDGEIGLKVQNERVSNEPWRAMGDHCYLDKSNENPELAIQAVVVGLKHVYKAYVEGNRFRISYPAVDLLPEIVVQDNFFPLFEEVSCGFLFLKQGLPAGTLLKDLTCGIYEIFYVMVNNKFYFVDKQNSPVKTMEIKCDNQLLKTQLKLPALIEADMQFKVTIAQLETIAKLSGHRIDNITYRTTLENRNAPGRTPLPSGVSLLKPQDWFWTPWAFFFRKLDARPGIQPAAGISPSLVAKL